MNWWIWLKKRAYEASNNNVDAKLITDVPQLNGVLDFPKYAEILAKIIENSTPHFSIGIFGAWGTGKTTLMKMLGNRLDIDSNSDILNWNKLTEKLEQEKLASFIRRTYGVEWVSKDNFSSINSYKWVFGIEKTIINKGSYQ